MMSASSSKSHGVRLKVRNLHKSYRSNEVLKGLSFEVNAGEIFVIMGPSGSGKSVLLRQLIGLEHPTKGEIQIEGKSIHEPGVIDQYRLAMVFQSGALLNSLTVAENVGLYLSEHRLKSPEEIRRIVSEKLEVVGLEGTEDQMPSELSGGMRKRVALARALVIEPQLIFYDEPTSELDPISSVVIAEEIVSLNRKIGVTSVVVTHDRSLAFGVAKRMAVMDEGRFLAIGTPEEVRRSEEAEVQRFLNVAIDESKLKGIT